MKNTVVSSDIKHNTYEVPVEELAWRPATYGIIIDQGKILLAKQHGQFHLPGGGLELGEMPEEGVVREVEEETGLIVSNPKLVGSISGFFTWIDAESTKPVHVQSILLYYACELVGGELSTDGFEEDEQLIGEMPEWIPLDQLDTIAAGSTIDWRSVVKKYIGKAG